MWDLFCNVIDNYGDVGVCWRLARKLRREHGFDVRLWVDDLGALHKLHPHIDVELPQQFAEGIEVRLWSAALALGEVEPGDVVIEGFGCSLPESFLQAMAQCSTLPLWLNLEYLSAEDWVAGCHKLPSPHPRLPLIKYFFFPGFGAQTGGLLREADLFAARGRFRQMELAAYWAGLGLPLAQEKELRISLFSYENPALPALLDAWAAGPSPITLLVPEGRVLPQLCAYFDASRIGPGEMLQRGQLKTHVLPFSDQAAYDHLLWACDFNFVRGEDSFVRAQWAARPFAWHIYPQADRAHEAKLEAFLKLYCVGMTAENAAAAQALFRAWNGVDAAPDIGTAWSTARSRQKAAQAHASDWANRLAEAPELANELVKFAQAHVKSRPFVD